jgi:hypothetical protein
MSRKHLLRCPIGPASKSQSRQRPFLKGILVILEREEPDLIFNRNVLYAALSTSQEQGKRRKGWIPWCLVRYPVQGAKRSPRLACLWRAQMQPPRAKRRYLRVLSYRLSVPLRMGLKHNSRLLMILWQVVTYVSPAIGISHTATVTSAFPATSSLSRDENLPPQNSSSHAFSEVCPPISEAMSHSFRIYFSRSQCRMTFSLARVRPLGSL